MSKDDRIGVSGARISAAEGLAIALRESAGPPRGADRRLRACLVVPNELAESAQEELIDELRRKGIDAVLLWRPVAAAMSWLRRYGSDLVCSVPSDEPIGRVLAVHLGLDGVEAVWLELIVRPESPEWVLAARRRPQRSCSSASVGRQWVERALSDAVVQCVGGEDPDLEWRALWAGPTAIGLFGESSTAADPGLWGIPAELGDAVVAALQESAYDAFPHDAPWLEHARARREGSPEPLGAVVTGELAATIAPGSRQGGYGNDQTLGEYLVQMLAPAATGRVLVEGAHGISHGVLARSAAAYAVRRAQGKPTYLDSLPKMEAMVEERARPEWRSLLDQGDRYVEGGKIWKHTTDLGGLSIPARSRELSLNVWVEPGEEVRRVKFQLPEPPEQAVHVELGVQIEPAQGRARVELNSKTPGQLGPRRVLLDWSRADLLEGDRQAVQAAYPRKCPQIQSRGAWRTATQKVMQVLKHCRDLDGFQIRERLTTSFLSELKDALNTGPPVAEVVHRMRGAIGIYRAVDSEGLVHAQFAKDQPVLRSVLDAIAEVELARIERRDAPRDAALRVLGYACARGSAVDRISGWILRTEHRVTAGEATFLAGCLRDAASVASLIGHLLERIQAGDAFAEITKSVGYLLQWRENALDLVDSSVAQRLVVAASRVISESVEASPGGARLTGRRIVVRERNCLVLIAFLLRRRVSDDSFLPPEGRQAREVKRILTVAEEGLASGRLSAMGGMVQSDELVRRVIRYIEREGTGTILAD